MFVYKPHRSLTGPLVAFQELVYLGHVSDVWVTLNKLCDHLAIAPLRLVNGHVRRLYRLLCLKELVAQG